MRPSYSDRLGAQTQLALGAAVQSLPSSVFSNSFSRHFIRSFDKPGAIVALITKEAQKQKQKQKRLESIRARKKSDLRPQFNPRETKSQRQRQPVISAPIPEFRQHPSVYHHGPMFENRQPLIQHNRLTKRHEALGSHPIHGSLERWHNGVDGASCDPNLPDREVPQHYRRRTEPGEHGQAFGTQLNLDKPRGAPDTSATSTVPVHNTQDEEAILGQECIKVERRGKQGTGSSRHRSRTPYQ